MTLHRICKYLLFTLLFAIACTNNGDIGVLYGEWAIDSITVDGQEKDIPVDTYFFKFQNDIVQICTIKPNHSIGNSTGTWQRNGDVLILNFTHTQSNVSENSPGINPPPELGLPGREISRLEILSESGSRLVLRYVNAEGQTLVYTLRKLK